MNREAFWEIVEDARRNDVADDSGFMSRLKVGLGSLLAEELISFDRVQDELMAESYRRDLWGAAFIINGGCSDDGFDYFRAWLISQGREVYERALEAPGSLETSIVMQNEWDAELEEFLYLPRQVYLERFGAELPAAAHPPWVLSGSDWDEDTVYEMFPALAERAEARFGAG